MRGGARKRLVKAIRLRGRVLVAELERAGGPVAGLAYDLGLGVPQQRCGRRGRHQWRDRNSTAGESKP